MPCFSRTNSDQYEVWTAKMGERTIETLNLPNSEAVRYSRQFALGSLFKSQNGSTWTLTQNLISNLNYIKQIHSK